jgi:hypothetical protein
VEGPLFVHTADPSIVVLPTVLHATCAFVLESDIGFPPEKILGISLVEVGGKNNSSPTDKVTVAPVPAPEVDVAKPVADT